MAKKKRITAPIARQPEPTMIPSPADNPLMPEVTVTLEVIVRDMKQFARDFYPGCEWISLVIQPAGGLPSVVVPVTAE